MGECQGDRLVVLRGFTTPITCDRNNLMRNEWKGKLLVVNRLIVTFLVVRIL